MKQLSGWLIVLCCALTTFALAQDSAEAVTDEANAKQTTLDVSAQRVGSVEQESTTKTPVKNSNRTATAPGSYNPSEEISDDLSVSFPVDI